MAFNKTITVGEVEGLNDYGDLLFKDEDGNDYKIKSKRDKLFQAVQEGNKLELHYDTYKGHDYIAGLTLLEGKAGEVAEKETAKGVKSGEDKKMGAKVEKLPERRDNQPIITENMCWKSLGDRIGDGSIDRDFPQSATYIKTQYYHRIAEKTGVKFKQEK